MSLAVSVTIPSGHGWVVRSADRGRLVADHASGAVANVSAQTVGDACDPRAIAARMVARLSQRDPSATVSLRRWGTFGERPAAVQIVEFATLAQLHGVTGGSGPDDPLIIVVVATQVGAATEVGEAFAALVAGVQAKAAPT